MYTIEFGCEETGEHGYEDVYETLSEAQYAYDYPGYGYYHIVEISEEEALNVLIGRIDEYVDERCSEEGDDIDEAAREEYWLAEVNYRIANKLPGWQLLQRHYN